MIVVDTNLIGYLYLASPRAAQAEATFRKDPDWAAPLLWRSELQNVLAGYIRKEQLTLAEAERIMEAAAGLLAGREYAVPPRAVLSLVPASTCSAYDCEFVALAEELKVPLVTVDREILEQFPDRAVSLDSFLQD